MAFLTKYSFNAPSLVLGDVIQIFIQEDGHDGGVTPLCLTGDRFVRQIGVASADLDATILDHTARLTIAQSSIDALSEVERAAEGKYRLLSYRDAQLTFVGIVRPGLGDRVRKVNMPYVVEATTGLHLLKSIPYPNFGVVLDRSKTLLETLVDALAPLGYSLGFRVVANALQFSGQGGDLIDLAHPDQSAFGNVTDALPYSCYDVVRAVCVALGNARLRQVNGLWHIDQPFQHATETTPTSFLYDASGTFIDVETVNPVTIDCEQTLRLSVPDAQVGAMTTWTASMTPGGDFKIMGRAVEQRMRVAIGRLSRQYLHDKAGEVILPNGGMEIEGANNQPDQWRSTAESRTRRAKGWSVPFDEKDEDEQSAYAYRIEAVYQQDQVTLPFKPGHAWEVEVDAGNWIADVPVTLRVHFSMRLLLQQGLPVPASSAPRLVMVQLEAGTYRWSNNLWNTGDVWERVYVKPDAWNDFAIDVDLDTLPASGKATLRFSALIDEYAAPLSDINQNPINPFLWQYDFAAYLLDRVFVEVLDDLEEAEPGTTSDVYVNTSGENATEEMKVVSRLGSGPTTYHRTYLSSAAETPLDNWLLVGSTYTPGRSMNDVAAEMLMRLTRVARYSEYMMFQAVTRIVDGATNLIADVGGDTLLMPSRYEAHDLYDRFGGIYLAAEDHTIAETTRTIEQTRLALFASNDGGGLAVRQYSNALLSSLFTSAVVVTNESLATQAYTAIKILPAPNEVFKSGWTITLIDADTLDLHVLTLTKDVRPLDVEIEIESFTPPKVIRTGAPIYASTDPLTMLILTDAGLRLVVQGSPIGLVAENVDANVSSLDVSGWEYGLLTDATVLIEQDVGPDIRATLTADAPRGSTTIQIVPITLDVSIGNAIYPGDFVTQAQLQILQDQIDLEVARFNSTAVAKSTEAQNTFVTSLDVRGTGPLQLRKGDALQVTNMLTGVAYRLEITVDALLSAFSDTTIQFSGTTIDVNVDDPLFAGSVVSLRVGLDGIDVRAPIFRSSTFDGTVDDDGELVEGGEGTRGWAMNKSGDVYAAGGLLRMDNELGFVLPLHSNATLAQARSLTFKDWASSPIAFDVELFAYFMAIIGARIEARVNSILIDNQSHAGARDTEEGFLLAGVGRMSRSDSDALFQADARDAIVKAIRNVVVDADALLAPLVEIPLTTTTPPNDPATNDKAQFYLDRIAGGLLILLAKFWSVADGAWIERAFLSAEETGFDFASVTFIGQAGNNLAPMIENKNVSSVLRTAVGVYEISLQTDTWHGFNVERQIVAVGGTSASPGTDETNYVQYQSYDPTTNTVTIVTGSRNKNGQWTDDAFVDADITVVVRGFVGEGQAGRPT